jgi:glyoxylase-like metal-dependent hydrolase (beta-lactamase superfamily II)
MSEVTSISAADLYAEIGRGSVPYILDVRNQDEFAAWQVEGPAPVATKNVPIWLAVEDVENLAQEIPENSVVVCAHGNGSAMLIEMLKDEGRHVRNLEGGTAAWAELVIPKELPGMPDGVLGWQIQRPSKACISYVFGSDGGNAVVVDPARFPEPYESLAAAHSMTITHVLDTHVHADHISGGPDLAMRTGASYHLPVEDAGPKVPWPNEPLADGQEIDLGTTKVHAFAIKMPGHTPGTTCLHLPGVFLLTGDTVFVRGVGRPDLTGKADELAKELFHTVHDRLQPLDPNTMILPAHWSTEAEIGADGLVATTLAHIFESTLMNEDDMETFVQEIVGTLPSAPDTYDTIRAVNAGKVVSAEEIEFLEIGKNQCAASTTVG